MMRRFLISLLAVFLLGAVQTAFHPVAETLIQTALRAEPHTDAHALATVPNTTAVAVSERRGGWYHIQLPSGQSGWVPMTNIRFGSAAPATGSGWDQTAYSLFESGRTGASGTTASTGVRGLNTGDIANASPDPQAVDQVAQWAVSTEQAKDFAHGHSLRSHKVPYLEPAKGAQ